MKPWEEALTHFLSEWKDCKDVIGVMVCGSFITGNPTSRSDIDVHIILSEEVDWRERGNRLINGFLIEYFANPPKQIRNYFEEDFNDRSTMSMVQFITGKVIFDNTGIIERLKEEATGWKEKRYEELDMNQRQLQLYGLWDSYDNLLDCYEEKRKDFHFVYYNSLAKVLDTYCSFLNLERIPDYQISRYFSDPSYLQKYLKCSFPDEYFSDLYLRAMGTIDQEEMMSFYRILTDYVLDKSGGFNIDGWSMRSGLS